MVFTSLEDAFLIQKLKVDVFTQVLPAKVLSYQDLIITPWVNHSLSQTASFTSFLFFSFFFFFKSVFPAERGGDNKVTILTTHRKQLLLIKHLSLETFYK